MAVGRVRRRVRRHRAAVGLSAGAGHDVQGFAPVAAADARVLVLGSAPSVISLQRGEYFGNPRNAFWPVMAELLGRPAGEDYAARTRMLLEARIAVWDVLARALRPGSLDASIVACERRGQRPQPGSSRSIRRYAPSSSTAGRRARSGTAGSPEPGPPRRPRADHAALHVAGACGRSHGPRRPRPGGRWSRSPPAKTRTRPGAGGHGAPPCSGARGVAGTYRSRTSRSRERRPMLPARSRAVTVRT